MMSDSPRILVHASIFLAGAFEVDLETRKLTPVDEQALQSHNLVMVVNGNIDPTSNDALSELACQKLIKAYLDESAKKKTVTPTMPPAEGVH